MTPSRAAGGVTGAGENAPQIRLHVVGAGLIGTSIALVAGRAGWLVSIDDVDAPRAERARERLADVTRVYESLSVADAQGEHTANGAAEPHLVVLAVPPASVGGEVVSYLRQHVHATVIDVASVKAEPQAYVQAHSPDASRFIPTHPLAGGEGSGPDSARSDLFRGRSWVLCPTNDVDAARSRLVVDLVHLCGAEPLWLAAAEHDRLLAVTSHLPQLIASALAAEVSAAFDPTSGARPVGGVLGHAPAAAMSRRDLVPASLLAGPALLDMTRIAASPSELWAQIVSMNLPSVRAALGGLTERLQALQASLDGSSEAALSVRDLVDRGRTARASIGRKHAGTPAPDAADGSSGRWWWVDTAVDDTPGTLARVFATADTLGVNIEDVRVDHAPYASSGIVSVAVGHENAAERLRTALRRDATDD